MPHKISCLILLLNKSFMQHSKAILVVFFVMDKLVQVKLLPWLVHILIINIEELPPDLSLTSFNKSTRGTNISSKYKSHIYNSTTKLSMISLMIPILTPWPFKKIPKVMSKLKVSPSVQLKTNKPPSKCYFKAKIIEPSLNTNLTNSVLVPIVSLPSISKSEVEWKAVKKLSSPKLT
jgi:hypothetical protein